jgi:hypothetical protein
LAVPVAFVLLSFPAHHVLEVVAPRLMVGGGAPNTLHPLIVRTVRYRTLILFFLLLGRIKSV